MLRSERPFSYRDRSSEERFCLGPGVKSSEVRTRVIQQRPES